MLRETRNTQNNNKTWWGRKCKETNLCPNMLVLVILVFTSYFCYVCSKMEIDTGAYDARPDNKDKVPKIYRATREAYNELLFGYSIALLIPTAMFTFLIATVCFLGQSRIRYYVNHTSHLSIVLFIILFVILLVYDKKYEKESAHFTGSNACDKFIICLYFLYGPIFAFLGIVYLGAWILHEGRFARAR